MHTVYVPSTQLQGDSVTITGTEQHHLRNVLRVEPGDAIQIMDGKGNVYIATVCDTTTAETKAKILKHEFHPKARHCLALFQGIPKNRKMELILQKTTELGVTQIVPMHTERVTATAESKPIRTLAPRSPCCGEAVQTSVDP